MKEPTGSLREWLQGIENEILYRLIAWVIKRRGVAFIYYAAPQIKADTHEIDKLLDEIVILKKEVLSVTQANERIAADRDAIRHKASEQSEYIQSHGLTEFEMNRVRQKLNAVLMYAETGRIAGRQLSPEDAQELFREAHEILEMPCF